MPNLAHDLNARPRVARATVTNNPIDYSVPYKTRVRGADRHFGFFTYFAKKQWPVVQEYINHFTAPGELVGDAFSGSGVTPVEGLVLGRRVVATDINPVALFITRMTAVAPVDIRQLFAAYEQVRSRAQRRVKELASLTIAELLSLLEQLDYPRLPIPKTVKRAGADTVDQLHTPRQLAGLTLLRNAINEVTDELMRDLLKVALAGTVRFTNRTYSLPAATEGKSRRSPYRGNAGFLRRFSFSLAKEELFYELDVWPTFERTFANVVEAKNETNELINGWYSPNNCMLGQVPASRIHELSGDSTVDYFFNDPPYSNEIHFVDLSVLWAAWLGLEVTEETRQIELMLGGSQNKDQDQFEKEFTAAMESVSRALKPDRWATLVYKHRDLGLWQNIVAACERVGLRYVNSVWQEIKIVSTRQVENPNINPKGDMYLNFRKMSSQKFFQIYPSAAVVELPSLPTYVAREIERLIVSYLGADIKLLTASVVQRILDSRAFRSYSDNPQHLPQDIQKVLNTGNFVTWSPAQGCTVWLLRPGQTVDPSLPAIDRARYIAFEFLHEKKEATTGEIRTHLLSRFAQSPGADVKQIDIESLLHSIARQTKAHHWSFEPSRVINYQQLRLFFHRSKADELFQQIEHRAEVPRPLRPNYEGITRLLQRLEEVNKDNKHFKSQSTQLLNVLDTMLHRLTSYRGELVEEVRTLGSWAIEGIDLRNMPFEEVLVQVILNSDARPFELYQEISENAFVGLDDDEILLRFHLVTLPEWKQLQHISSVTRDDSLLGIPLLDRS